MPEPDADLHERVARLEAEVARLAGLIGRAPKPPSAVPPPIPGHAQAAPAHYRAAPTPRPFNPVILVAAAGAVIFLAGAAFFLHLAIQMGWVGPELRFLMGLLAGCGLGVYAGRMFFRNAQALGACLLAAGLGTLLFTLYAGAFRFHFYTPSLGFLGAGLITLVAGGLAARARSGAALCAALASGFAAPALFSQGGHHEVALAVYLAVLMGATLAVPYAARTGARWTVARWLAPAGVWLWLGAADQTLLHGDAGVFLGLVLLHYALAGLWIWLPGQGEARPSTPTLLWVAVTLAVTGLLWSCWGGLHFMREAFAGPALGVAALNLALVKPLRTRLGGSQADLGLLVLAGAHLALAVPIALDWAWVGPLWGVYAAGLAWAAGAMERQARWEPAEVRALTLLAVAMAGLATLRWLVDLDLTGVWPFLNHGFAQGALAAVAWAFLARRGGFLGQVAFVGLEGVGNVVLALELGRLVDSAGLGKLAEDITHTLVLAGSGALQWLAGLRRPAGAKGLALAGYGLLGVASLKLVVWDLAQASTPLRALVFLGVGGIFLAAAVVGNKVREGKDA